MTNKEPTQVYRVTLSVDVKVAGGNDKGRRISAEEYVQLLINYPLYENDAGPETQGVGWYGADYVNGTEEGKHAPYQIDESVPIYHVTSVRKVGPIKYQDNNRWTTEEREEGYPE